MSHYAGLVVKEIILGVGISCGIRYYIGLCLSSISKYEMVFQVGFTAAEAASVIWG